MNWKICGFGQSFIFRKAIPGSRDNYMFSENADASEVECEITDVGDLNILNRIYISEWRNMCQAVAWNERKF